MKIGILGAEQQETALLQEVLDGTERKIATATFYEGTIGNVNVVLVHSGIGKVNAAIATQILITEFKVDYVINTGIAGSLAPSLNIFDIVCSTDAIEHDFDATYFGYKRGQIPQTKSPFFQSDPYLAELIVKAFSSIREDATVTGRFSAEDSHLIKHIKLVMGRIASGDIFVTKKEMKERLHADIGASCVEMEGAAVAHTCVANKIPYLVLRCISDLADKENVIMLSYDEFSKKAAFLSSRLVLKLLSLLS
ncbi:MAG: 5'-methylthioadenosine/adenosylhomocysteine nucleosidase [Treponema sp.]